MTILFCIISLFIGIGITCCILYPKVKSTKCLDEQTVEQNKQLEFRLKQLETQKEGLLSSIKDLENQAKESAELFLQQHMNLAAEKLDRTLEQKSIFYQENEEAYKEIYLQSLNDCIQDFTKNISNKRQELEIIQLRIDELKNNIAASVEANKRAEEIRNKNDFYKLNLSDEDIAEIKHLRAVIPYLRNIEPLNKVIWKCYYEKPTSDLIGRVVGSGAKTGIYKITNLTNQMCYIGQAVNIAERWKQHIKRGIGAETPTRNKLYPAMLSFGVENFSFEIIEECDRALLNDKEDYWQEFFKAKEFGYSIK